MWLAGGDGHGGLSSSGLRTSVLPERSHPRIPQPFASTADAAPAAETNPSAETSALPHAARRLTALPTTPSTPRPAAMRGEESPRRAYERIAGRGSMLSASAVLRTRPSARYNMERKEVILVKAGVTAADAIVG